MGAQPTAQADCSASGRSISTASTSSASKSSRKRKLPSNWSDADAAEHDNDDAIPEQVPEDEAPKKSRKKDPNEEKRLRRFRPKPPQNFHEVYQRATSQRFYVLGRRRAGTAWCPEEYVELTGSTGNIYVVHIAQQPTCTCPHNKVGHQCKHILYVLSRVLRAPFDLVYQLALLPSELVSIFDKAPPIQVGDDATKPKEDKNRKAIEGDCPICFMPFEGEDATVYCRAQCGQNIHKECFEMWAATKRQSRNASDQVTCPMCRTPWQGDDDMQKRVCNTGVVGAEGYVNIADQLGISTFRGAHITMDHEEVFRTGDGDTGEIIPRFDAFYETLQRVFCFPEFIQAADPYGATRASGLRTHASNDHGMYGACWDVVHTSVIYCRDMENQIHLEDCLGFRA